MTTAQAQVQRGRGIARLHGWHTHPGVRSGSELTIGERSADKLRNGMGSWGFVFGALVFLAVWMIFNNNSGFDKYPFILLNLVLSCLAALQGAILLIAAKRSDQISAELAQHDFQTDSKAEALIEQIFLSFSKMAEQHADLHRQVADLSAQLAAHGLLPEKRPREAAAAPETPAS